MTIVAVTRLSGIGSSLLSLMMMGRKIVQGIFVCSVKTRSVGSKESCPRSLGNGRPWWNRKRTAGSDGECWEGTNYCKECGVLSLLKERRQNESLDKEVLELVRKKIGQNDEIGALMPCKRGDREEYKRRFRV